MDDDFRIELLRMLEDIKDEVQLIRQILEGDSGYFPDVLDNPENVVVS